MPRFALQSCFAAQLGEEESAGYAAATKPLSSLEPTCINGCQ